MRLRARARAASRRWPGVCARPANNVYTEDSEPWRFYLSSQRRYLLFVPLFLAACALVGGLFGPGASTVSAAPQAGQRNVSPTSDEDLKASIESFTKIYDLVDQNYSKKPIAFNLVREEIPRNSVDTAFWIKPGIAYMKIQSFTETTSHEVDENLKALGEQNIKGLILDLRENPGGLLQEGVATAGHWLDRGQVVGWRKGPAYS